MSRATIAARWGLGLALVTGRVDAQVPSGAIAAGTTAGLLSSRVSVPLSRLLGRPLPDWTSPVTRTSSAFSTACSVVVEAQLYGTASRNFLLVTLKNDSSSQVWLDSSAVFARLTGGLSRRMLSLYDHGPVDAGWTVTDVFAFPNKEMFSGGAELTVTLPYRRDKQDECVATVKFVRPPGVHELATSSVAYGQGELYMGGGPHFMGTGGQRELGAGKGSALLQIGGGWYPSFHHGLFFDLVLDFYTHDGARRALPTFEFENAPPVIGVGLFPTYAFRLIPKSWLSITYFGSVFPYFYSVQDGRKEGETAASTAVVAWRQRLRVAAPYWRMQDGTGFGVALSVVHTLIPHGELGEVSLAGSSLGAMIEFLMDGS